MNKDVENETYLAEGETSSSKETSQEEIPSIPYYRLYRYASALDILLLIIGILSACVNGASLPVLFIFFGDITQSFTFFGTYQQCDFDYDKCLSQGLTNLSRSDFEKDVIVKTENFENDAVQTVYYMVYIGCATFVLSAFQVSTFSLQSVRQMKKIRINYFRAILRQDIGFHDQTSSGSLNVRLSSDINKVAEGMGEKISSLIQYLSMGVSGVVIGIVYAWKMGLVTLSVAPLLGVASTTYFLVSSVYTKKELTAYATAGSVAEEAISAIRTVTALGCQRRISKRYAKNLAQAKRMGLMRGSLTGVSNGLLYLCMYGTYGLAFWYGSTLVFKEEIDVGDMMTTFFGIVIGAFAIGTAGSYFGSISEGKAAAAMIFKVIDRVPEIDIFSKEGDDTSDDVTIELSDVEFAYPTRPDAQVLKKVSLKVNHGEKVALVGHSGCGKSTTVQLIQRFYDPQNGEVKVGGKNIREICVGKLRQIIGVVSQEPVLFATTIGENIRWGKEDATQDEVIEAARQANALDFVSNLPEKFDTLVGESGGQLSGGQKQRIAIARAILRNPRILLLDEATSALDTESEAVVQSALDKASKGRTTIIIAHRLSTVKNADKIIAFDGGKIVESGTHDELQKLNGVYASLCQAQQFIHKLDDEVEKIEEDKIIVEKKEQQIDENEVSFLPDRVKSMDNLPHEPKSGSITIADEKKEEEKVSVTRLLKMNKPEWGYMAVGAITAAIAGASDPVSAILFADFLTIFTLSDADLQNRRAIEYACGFVGIGASAFLCYSIEAALFSKAGMELTTRLRDKAFASILRQDISFFDDHNNSTGVLCSRLASDAAKVQGCTGGKLGMIMKNFSALAVSLGIAFAYSWKLTLLMMAFIPILILGGIIEIGLVVGDEEKMKKEYAESSNVASEAISNVRTIASLHREEIVLQKYSETLKKPIGDRKRKCLFLGLGYGYSQCTIFFTYAAVFRLGIELVITGDTTFDNVFRVITAILFGALAVAQNSSFAPDFAEAQTAAYRILKLLDTKPDIDSYSDEGVKPTHCKGEIEISSASFTYPTRQETLVLNELSLSVKKGQTIALVGQSGCGKSTTIQLLERFYDVTDGQVAVDGVDVKSLNISWLRQQIGLVSQEPVLFDLSIKENILYGDCERQATDEEVIKAASDANAHNFISSLPQGYDTPAGSKGGQLSGGQKQRVAIARALLRNPKILLLDEATSALDTESEKIVQEALDTAREGRTCIVIAHRLSTIQNADKIAVVDKGSVIEFGSHDELIAQKGAYYSLANA